tara:strand:- start:22185 stop:22370 length:186 start_codon:yes stop_codon:yes gene_type:complete
MNFKEAILEVILFILYFIFIFFIGNILSILNLSKIDSGFNNKINSYWVNKKNKKKFKSSYK